MHKKGLQKVIGNFSVALEQGHAAVYRRNFDSDVYEYMGEYIKEITGYATEELTPALWDSLILRTEQKGALKGLSLVDANRLVRSGQVDRWQADVQIRTRSGQTRWVTDMSTVLRDEEGGCLGVLLDITDRKEAEKQLADLTKKLRLRNQEIEADLAMAREVQQALVIKQPTRFPLNADDDAARLFFHHRYIPAEMLAGDFFQILPLTDHEVGVFVCDVMGHGVRAALLTTFLRGLIEELIPKADDPGTFLGKINNSLRSVFCQDGTLLFATALYLVLDVSTGRVRYANAGHSCPLCLQEKTGSIKRLALHENTSEPALGIIEDFTYSTSEHVLADAESLLLYTDGLFEAYNDVEEIYGEERLAELVRQKIDLSPEQLMDEVIADVHGYAGSNDFEDDVCLLFIKPASTPR
jgi:PAS domain S-box-containing protein